MMTILMMVLRYNETHNIQNEALLHGSLIVKSICGLLLGSNIPLITPDDDIIPL